MDYVLPNDVPWKWASKPYKKARKAVLGAEKKMWKSAYKGMMKNYTSPLYDTIFFPSNGEEYPHPDLPRLGSPIPRQSSFSPPPPMPRRFSRKKRSSTRGRYNRKARRFIARKKHSSRLRYRGKPAHVKRAKTFKPVFSLDAVARTGRRPRKVYTIQPKVASSVAPWLYNIHQTRTLDWDTNKQEVFSHSFLRKSEMNEMLAQASAISAKYQSCLLTEVYCKTTIKNFTNNPIDVQIYRYSYKKSNPQSIDDLWNSGMDDYNSLGAGGNPGFTNTRVGARPQLSQRLTEFIRLHKPTYYRIGGGGSVDFTMKMKGTRMLSTSLMDQTGDNEYKSGYTFGFLMIANGTLAVDSNNVTGYSSGRIGLMMEGHKTLRVVENNHKTVYGYATQAPLLFEKTMNIESDQPESIAVA